MRGRMPRAIVMPSFKPYAKELLYIESSGTQYIDTLFKPNQNTRVVMDCDLAAQGSAYTPFGAWNSDGSGQFVCLCTASITSRIYYASVYKNGTVSILGRHNLDMNKNSLSVDGVTDITLNDYTFACNYPLYLCTLNNAGTPRSNNMSSLKIYACQIYDNGTLVRDFIPVMDYDGVACLFDKVEKKLYYNAGTGSFTYGEVA